MFVLLMFNNSLVSQNYSNEYGAITQDEITMTSYPNDTTAEAVKIYDIGETGFYYVDYSFDMYFKRKTKIKVLKDSYIDNAYLLIPIYKGNAGLEKLHNIEITTYNHEKNMIVKTQLDKEQIYDETVNENWILKRIAYPGVKKGSVIEIKYEIISPYKFLLRDWEFQSDIPIIYSKYITKMIPFYEYTYRFQGADKFDEYSKYQEKGYGVQAMGKDFNIMIYEFAMKNVPAFKDESFLSTVKDYIIKLDFQLSKIYHLDGSSIRILSTWEEVVKDLLKDERFGLYIKKAENDFSKIVKENNLLAKSEPERIEFALNYVKQNFSTDNYTGKYSNKTINEFLKEKKGNKGAVNLYLIGALQALEIKVFPLISSTRDNGKIVLEYPFVEPFNYVSAYVQLNDKPMVLDATDLFCPNNLLPLEVINDLGLIVRKEDVKWINLAQIQVLSLIQNEYKATLSENADTIFGSCVTTSNNYSAMKFRKQFENKLEKIEKDIVSGNIELFDSVKTENYNDVSKPYIIKYGIFQTNNRIQNKIFIDPFFNEPLKENPLKAEERKYPVDMIYPKTVTYKTELEIPDHYRVEQLPEAFNINTDLFMLNYLATDNNGIITVNASYQFKKSVYLPEDYSKIKRYFGLIIKYLNQKIVIVKSQ